MTSRVTDAAAEEEELEYIADTAAGVEDDAEDAETLFDDDDVPNTQTTPKAAKSQLPPTEDLAELARFREEWRADLARHRDEARKPPAEEPKPPDVTQDVTSTSQQTIRRRPTVTAEKPPEPIAATSVQRVLEDRLSPQLSKALGIYRRAVTHEQNSELDEALRLYRQAFRLHEDVAKVYERIEYGSSLTIRPHVAPRHTTSADQHAIDAVAQSLGGLHILHPGAVTLPANHGIVTGTLASLVESWPADLKFEPEDERRPVHLQTLPDEILVHVLQYLNTTALERFALVNRKARILTLDSTLWRHFVTTIYKPPQIGDDEDVVDLLQEYVGDFRRVYIEHPRVRLDGVYIAVCHYIRDGLSENAWVNINHLITYHRYLRFYPNGEVLSLLANEEVSPQHIIPLLKPTLRMKGLLIGTWRLTGTQVTISDLMDPSGAAIRYSFQMVLELRSRPLGRWNRLDIRAYDSVALSTGETTPLPLKNDRPFWFSKVRSYGHG